MILTPDGIVMVKDKQDKYIQETVDLIEKDEWKTDEQKAAGIDIVKKGKYSLPGGGQEGNESTEDTIIREVYEELNLHVESRHMQMLAEIVGKTRRHVIYLVRTTGMIALNPDESITGIGFLKEKNVFPLTHTFFQTHIMRLYSRYFDNGKKQKEERAARLVQFVSNIRVSEVLINEWFKDEELAEMYRGKNHRRPSPELIEPSPNLTIVNAAGFPLPARNIPTHTIAKDAKFIPQRPSIAKAKKPSNPSMPAVVVPVPPISGAKVKSTILGTPDKGINDGPTSDQSLKKASKN
jgi:ADP-ribose pyrophosphatase YjhB (NUDIX family)